MTVSTDLHEAIRFLKKGDVIAYATEAVYGLGCDPFNEKAVSRLLKIKHREMSKGLILIASHWRQIQHLTKPVDIHKLNQVMATWPGPVTWVFPASQKTPPWLLGYGKTIAVRIINHPQAKALCDLFHSPIVSTSANIQGKSPALTYEDVEHYFNDTIPFILKGKVGGLPKPTSICDVMTGRILRP